MSTEHSLVLNSDDSCDSLKLPVVEGMMARSSGRTSEVLNSTTLGVGGVAGIFGLTSFLAAYGNIDSSDIGLVSNSNSA